MFLLRASAPMLLSCETGQTTDRIIKMNSQTEQRLRERQRAIIIHIRQTSAEQRV
jgi:hypothetical protein